MSASGNGSHRNGRDREVVDLSMLGPAEVRQRMADGLDTVLIPLGALERHGNPHTPLGLDSIIVGGLVERAARLAGVVHTPVMHFGWSPMHVGPIGDGCGAA